MNHEEGQGIILRFQATTIASVGLCSNTSWISPVLSGTHQQPSIIGGRPSEWIWAPCGEGQYTEVTKILKIYHIIKIHFKNSFYSPWQQRHNQISHLINCRVCCPTHTLQWIKGLTELPTPNYSVPSSFRIAKILFLEL